MPYSREERLPAEQTGVVSIPVQGPHETKRVVEAIIAVFRIAVRKPYEWIQLQRLGVMMSRSRVIPRSRRRPESGCRAWPDGKLYLFRGWLPRNYSRIGIGECVSTKPAIRQASSGSASRWSPKPITSDGPARRWLRRSSDHVSWSRSSVTDDVYGILGARSRIALATSEDLFHWNRLGLATFGRYRNVDIGDVDDKDASVFPVAIPNPSGKPELAMLHRPLFPGTRPEEPPSTPRPSGGSRSGKHLDFLLRDGLET